jgi:hypothetical protein
VPDGGDKSFVGNDRPGMPARLERAGQLAGVPALAGGEDGDVQITAARR